MNYSECNEIHNLFNQQLIPHIYQYIQASDYDPALKVIEEFSNLYSRTDKTGWLKNQCNSWQAFIYERQENYAKALSLYQSAYQLLQTDDNMYVYKKLNIARVLHKLERNQEAIAQLEPIFSAQLYDSPPELLMLMKCYVDCLTNSDRLNEEDRKLVLFLAEEFNTEIDGNTLTLQNVRLAIEHMVRENKTANRRYSLLVIQLHQIETIDLKLNLLQRYISEEKIGYYCNLAVEKLEQINN